ncbi:MAG TPA: LamG domain-containing protein, partial [Desertimonas sp.]|nr:LamG domain-containing protein [Desertimonas sp.]
MLGVAVAAAVLGVLVATPNGNSSTPGLVAAYAFDEGSGVTVTDASGNSNSGTAVSSTWSSSGKYGKALSFNGTSSRVTIPDTASLHLSSAMTLEAWVRPSAVTNKWRDVIMKGNDNYYLEATSNKSSRPAGGAIIGGSTTEAISTTALPVNTWTHLAATYDGSALRLYVNGNLTRTTAKTGAITASANALTIGSDPYYGQYFAGLIDEIRIYNTALTQAQIQSDMATALDGSDTQAPSAPGTLSATAVSGSRLDLAWGAATDN